MQLDPRDHSPEEFLLHGAALKLSPHQLRRVLAGVLARGELPPRVLPKRFEPHTLPRLTLERHLTSPLDNFQKLIFRTTDGLALETVLIPLHKPGAVSLCLSSQVGCVMGCLFCATARMPERRNLKTWEIVDQFTQARLLAESQGRRVTGCVFMGMGEPFLNYSHVIASAKLFSFPLDKAIAGKAITISTVGLVPEIERFTEEDHTFRLSISLGAATDEKRRFLVPVASRTPLREILRAAKRYGERRRTRVNLAYVCISSRAEFEGNVGERDAEALGRLVEEMAVRIDLIPVTDHTGRFSPPDSEEMSRFRDALTRHVGQPVVVRYSGGADIRAACGTLAGTS